MRKYTKRLALLLLSLALVVGLMPRAYAQEEPAGYIIMSVEKLTIGQGFIFEPQRVPYYRGETLAQVLVRTMEAEEREVRCTGTVTDGFYLAQLYDPGRPGIAGTVPAYIRDMWRALYDAKPDTTPAIENTDTEEPDYLGEFDYFAQAGWVYSVHGAFPQVGAAQAYANDGLVVRWQFSLVGLGGDVGGPSTTGSAALMDRTELYTVLAAVRDDEDILASSENRAAYDRLRQQCEDLTTTAEAVEADLSALKKALGSNVIAELQLPTYEQDAVRRYDFGTAQETVMQDFPDYLRATVDGKSKILTGITEWRVDRVFGAPGTYAFTPVLPERYKNYTVVCDYPAIQVTVLPPAGDMNGDGALDARDVSRMAAAIGSADAAFDLDGSGAAAWHDLHLLLGVLGQRALLTPDAQATAAVTTQETEGDTVTVTVSVPAAAYDTYCVALTYDTAALEFVSAQAAEPFLQTAVQQTDSGVQLGGVSAEGAQRCETPVTVTLRALSGAETEIEGSAVLLQYGGYVTPTDGAARLALLARQELLPGDLDGDGVIGIADAELLAAYYNGTRQLTQAQLAAADLDGSGRVDMDDVALLIRYANGVINAFPAQ